MLSCHVEPFLAFVEELQLPGCEVHLYRGANAFGMILDGKMLPQEMPWWDKENLYFLAGVRPGMAKRASDADILKRNMFTLDFDIKNELLKRNEKLFEFLPEMVPEYAERIIGILCMQQEWKQFRYAVLSGNGLHVHYFGAPVEVKKDEWAAGMKNIFTEINTITPLPCDMGCGNAGRIMRMPGSWNMKGEHKKKVDFLCWEPSASLGSLTFIQQRGKHALAKLAEQHEAERKDFAMKHPEGGSDVIALINMIPVEQVVKQLLNCNVSQEKKDGGLRFIDSHGKERGFFKHHEHNIIVHEGTSLFPPANNIGYNPLGLVKVVKGMDARDAIAWFAERMGAVRDAVEREKREWAEEHKAKELELFGMKFPTNND